MTTPTSFALWKSTCGWKASRLSPPGTGPDALAKAVAVRPDLVLLDVRMPGIDGYTICARIRADSSLAAIPVIIVTANHGATEVEAARRAGADDFLVKPFLPTTLLDMAKAMLS
jgi:CheY-like chemotaxis protein